MIQRRVTTCGGCNLMIGLRLVPIPGDRARFYYLCPHCGAPNRGLMEHPLQDYCEAANEKDLDRMLATLDVRLEAPEQAYTTDEAWDALAKATVDISTPLRMNGNERTPLSSPSNAWVTLLGENIKSSKEFRDGVAYAMVFRQDVLRSLEYYIDGSPSSFWQFAAPLAQFESMTKDLPPSSPFREHALAHDIWASWLTLLCHHEWIPADEYAAVLAYMNDCIRAFQRPELLTYFQTQEESGDLESLDRGLYDCTRVFAESMHLWGHAVNRLAMPQDRVHLLDGLTLAQDEFKTLRDVYQQTFEAICRASWVLLPSLNIVAGREPQQCDLHFALPGQRRQDDITRINDYKKRTAAQKIAALMTTSYGPAFSALNSRTRNAIGHASARHDLREGKILSHGQEAMSYLDFMAVVFRLAVPLQLSVRALGAARRAATVNAADQENDA